MVATNSARERAVSGLVGIQPWIASRSTTLLRLSLGFVFVWFGALKWIPGASPAEAIAGQTVQALTFQLVGPRIALPLLASFEMSIGLALLFGLRPRVVVAMLLIHLMGTFTPLVLFPLATFRAFLVPTLLGQYILKNLVLVAAAVVLVAPQDKKCLGPPSTS